MSKRFSSTLGFAAVGAGLVLLTSGCAYVARISNATPPAGITPVIGAIGTPAFSADGHFIAYAAQADAGVPGASEAVFRRDYSSQQVTHVDVASDGSPADDFSSDPAISSDGRFVAFSSYADNLVPNGADENGLADVFVRDMQGGATVRVSVATNGTEADDSSYLPSISSNGRYVAFTSDSDLLDPNDENGSSDVFVRDMQTNTTTLVSVATDGTPTDFGAWDGVISADGQHVAFTTDTDWVLADQNAGDDIYMRDLALSRTRRVTITSTALDGGDTAAISSDGGFVAYEGSNGSIYVRDMGGANTRVTPAGIFGAGDSPAISADGRWVAYTSRGNATSTDTNGSKIDVFLRDMLDGVTTVGSTTNSFTQLPVDSRGPTFSADGRYLGWVSAGAFDPTDNNGLADVYTRAVAVPRIASVTPTSVARGTTATLTVTGGGFIAPVFASVGLAGVGVSVTSATWVSDASIKVVVTVDPEAAVGPTTLEVLNEGSGMGLLSGGAARCAGCLTIS